MLCISVNPRVYFFQEEETRKIRVKEVKLDVHVLVKFRLVLLVGPGGP